MRLEMEALDARRILAALFVFLLSACSTHVPIPERPAMPTDSIDKGVEIDTFVAACIAEIERREGYEILLRNAIAICNGDSK